MINKYINKTLLLGISGGPDSIALFYLLKDVTKLHLAHINHNWRDESSKEAQQLQLLAKQFNIPFYLKTLDPKKLVGNLEDACRNERLNFFKQIYNKIGADALALGHHADDQAETVLKRLFEGAHLDKLGAMRTISQYEGMTVWRPLLQTNKASIVKMLESNHISYFEDKTNLDPQFLRGRFRTKIIPYLQENFEKDIRNPLSRISQEAHELQDYLLSRVDPILKMTKTNTLGSFLDLSKFDIPSYELRFILRQHHLSHSQLDNAIQCFYRNDANKTFPLEEETLIIDRKRLFRVKNPIEKIKEIIPIKPGKNQYGIWTIELDTIKKPQKNHNWESFWNNNFVTYLPEDQYFIGPPNLNSLYPNSQPIKKWLTNHKIPTFLRSITPVIWKNNTVHHEFLTGKNKDHPCEKNTNWVRIKVNTY